MHLPWGVLTYTISPFSYLLPVICGSGWDVASMSLTWMWYLWRRQRLEFVLECHVVPVDCFQCRTILPGCNGFDISVTAFYDAIPSWDMSTPEPQMHAPAAHKFLKLSASECSVIVSQYLGRWPTFIKIASNWRMTLMEWLPYCKMRRTTINKHQKVSTIVNLFLHAQIPFSPTNWCWINQLAGFTGSDNWFNKFFGHCQVDDPCKVQLPLNARVTTLLVCQPLDFCLIDLLQQHNFPVLD